MAGPLFFTVTAGLMEPDVPAMGRAEPADGPAILDSRLEVFDGESLVGGGLVRGGVTGARGDRDKFEFGEQFLMALYCLVVVEVRRALASVSC